MDEQQKFLTRHQRRELQRQEKKQHGEHQERSQTMKKVMLWAAVGIALAAAVFAVIKTSGGSPATPLEPPAVTSDDWTAGPEQAKATLIEYSDFQCPACGVYYPVVKDLKAAFPDDLRVVYRHFPLTTVHANAFDAALASEAAGVQGKFWEMHDRLFEKQDEWSKAQNVREIFAEYAQTLGLDVAAFRASLDDAQVKAQVDNDIRGANSISVDSTPTFYLNGKLIQNPRDFEQFRSVIQQTVTGS